MKVLIAMDSFKGNLSSLGVADIVESGIRKVYPSSDIAKIAIADGGEGTVDAVVSSMAGEYVYVEVTGPMGNRVRAKYGIVEGCTAVIEMSEAFGLCLVPEGKRNPMKTTTYGTGELIQDALDRGLKKIIVGIGGSATNDGGVGMAMALGARFINKFGQSIGIGGGSLDMLDRINIDTIDKMIRNTTFIAACDINNPLYGNNGASRVFAPQKGASPETVEILDKNLLHYSEIVKRDLSIDAAEIPGAGSAGGLGYGLMAFCGAELMKGINIVLGIVKIDEKIQAADIVITGEGRIDGQTVHGKAPVGIAARAKKYHKPVFAIAGFIDKGAELVYEHGIDSIMSSMVGPMSISDSMS
jgi:glycerate kinase